MMSPVYAMFDIRLFIGIFIGIDEPGQTLDSARSSRVVIAIESRLFGT